MSDWRTVAYFDSYTPEYYEERYNHVVQVINAHPTPGASLIDIGCGNGNILEFIKNRTPVRRLDETLAARKTVLRWRKGGGA